MTDFNDTIPPPVSDGVPPADQRQWAMIAHLSSLVGAVVTAGWAGSIGCFLGPLIIWLVKKDTMPFVDDQAKEALNFNITLAGVFLILFMAGVLTLFIGFIVILPIMFIIGIAALVFIVIAAIKANEGVAYRYPFTIRLIK
ncbi:DUF4870 domain-containing protein [Luteimonas sp. RIT-PG2_3]|jgi:uncharacterized Tic20 family protein